MRTCGREWWSNEATRTLLMVNLAGIMERADEALLPGVYREIGLAMHASPAKLGSLTLVRSLVQAFCAPLAAYASVNHNRANVIALGAFLWAVATFFVGISGTFTQVSFTCPASTLVVFNIFLLFSRSLLLLEICCWQGVILMHYCASSSVFYFWP